VRCHVKKTPIRRVAAEDRRGQRGTVPVSPLGSVVPFGHAATVTSADTVPGKPASGLRSTRLREARAAAGLKQSQLLIRLEQAGRRLGVNVPPRESLKRQVSRWENGAPMSADYRRLFVAVYGISEEQLGFSPWSDHAAPAPPAGSDAALIECAAQLRLGIDTLLGAEPAAPESGLDCLDERVDLHARDCVRLAPATMLSRLLADFHEVQALASQRHQPRTMIRLYGITANFASLIADELMVLGRPADAQAWHATAKTVADRTEDPALQARTRSLNALLYLYYGDPARAVALAHQAQAFGRRPAAATALAAAVEAFAQSRAGNESASRHALRAGEELFRRQSQTDRVDSIFGFTERRWRFYRSRALLRIGTTAEARAAADDAISCYPIDVVGDPTVVTLDLARRLAFDGDLLQSAEVATAVLAEMRPEHRTGLFTTAGREVLASVSALGRAHPAIQQLQSLTQEN
jgi:transcriptional regulator with XRE-family HTH domain